MSHPDPSSKPTEIGLVVLRGGPFDGVEVERPSGRSLLIEVEGGDRVARYRQGRNRYEFTFREYDTVIARV